ncbi:MAG: endonuclease domain-containing protein [Hyphomonadaceae bacterium]|jgi:very-short-patch-repair endonuclease|nr:endonuclease domain-containing protein [Hyphomonadaceae bacterium]
MRSALTKAETRLWARLKGAACGGFKFRRQHPIGRYFADFACTEARLIVEVDGDVHSSDNARLYDAERTAFLENNGWSVIRFTNEAVLNETSRVIEKIGKALRGLVPARQAPSALSGHLPHSGRTGTGEEISN